MSALKTKLPPQEASHLGNTSYTHPTILERHRIVDGEELARILKISRRTLEGWQRRKKLPFVRLSHNCVRYKLNDVLVCLDRRYTVREAGTK